MRQHLFHTLNQLATDRWARRGVRVLLRAAWLSVCIWCIGLGATMVWGWPLRINILGAAALAVIGGGVALLLRPRLRAPQAARRLDQRFHLDEQLATATEVAATNPPPGSVAARLLAEAEQTAALLQRRIARRQRPPWNDMLTLGLLVVVALGLWIMSGVGLPQFNTTPLPLPPLAQPQDPAQQLPEEPQQPDPNQPGAGAQPGGSEPAPNQAGGAADPQTLEALADALRDQGATRPAAEALDRGDVRGAASQLRELADQASQLSEATRNTLADNLRAAADDIRSRNPGLAEQLEQSADNLERGGQRAAEALDDLAQAIEDLPTTPPPAGGEQGEGEQGQNGQGSPNGQGAQEGPGAGQNGNQGEQPAPDGSGSSPGQGGGGAGDGPAGEQRPADTSDRLGVEGQPVPLDSAGQGDIPAEPSGPLQPGQGQQRPGFTQGGNSSNQRVDVGADPLRVPLDERDVVQEYFQP